MLTEMVEYDHKIEEKVKAMQSDVKEHVQAANSDGKEINWDSNQQFGTKGRNKHPTGKNEETRIQKNEERLRDLLDSFKCSNI